MRGVLQSVLAESAVEGAPPAGRSDVLVAAVAASAAVLEFLIRPQTPWSWVTLAIALGLFCLLPGRRQRPLITTLAWLTSGLALDLARLTTQDRSSMGLHATAFMLLGLYALGRWSSGRDCGVGAGATFVAATVAAVVDARTWTDVVGGYTVLYAALALGLAIRYRTAAQTRTLEQLRLFERERLARDLHDTVAHHVSAIAIQAQVGIARADTDPSASLQALRAVEVAASKTLAEMRSMVRALRDPDSMVATTSPLPLLSDFLSLARTNGRPYVHVSVDEGLELLHPSIVATLFRVAREAVTNAIRHARMATEVKVDLYQTKSGVQLRVANDGAKPSSPSSNGFGVLGMRERVGLLGGTFRAGPKPDGGWLVEASIPVEVNLP